MDLSHATVLGENEQRTKKEQFNKLLSSFGVGPQEAPPVTVCQTHTRHHRGGGPGETVARCTVVHLQLCQQLHARSKCVCARWCTWCAALSSICKGRRDYTTAVCSCFFVWIRPRTAMRTQIFVAALTTGAAPLVISDQRTPLFTNNPSACHLS